MDDVIALRDALLEDILDAEFGRADLRAFRANLDALIAAVEARAAGSLVERVETEPCHATMLCPYPQDHPIHADEGDHEFRLTPPPAVDGDCTGRCDRDAETGACMCEDMGLLTPPAPDTDRPADWSATWRDDVTGAGFTRDEAIAALTVMTQRYAALRKAGLAIFPDADMLVEGDRITMDRARVEAFSVALASLTPPATDTDRCPVDGCDDLPEDHYHPAPDPDRLRALVAGMLKDHAYNVGLPFDQRHVDWLFRNSPSARALLADRERSDG